MMKKELRINMLHKLNKLSVEQYEGKSIKIAKKLFKHPIWKDSQVIGITMSRFPEVNTTPIIEKAWQENKTVVIPKCNPQEKQMTFRILENFSQVETVFYGLSEPIESKTAAVKKTEIDLLIVPGVVYNKKGYRIGFGGGYYDRYLASYLANTISLAFSMQIVDDYRFPVEEHDIPVQTILTETEVFTVGK